MAKMNNWNKKNQYNPDSMLYRRLTKLLSGPIVSYDRQATKLKRAEEVVNGNKLFKSASGQHFKKQTYDPFNSLQAASLANARRAERYLDFQQMEFDGTLHTVLDIYADEITTSNDYQKLLRINCPNEEIKEILTTLFYDQLNIDFNLYGWVRNTCKYGDGFLYLDIDQELGVKNVIMIPSAEIERLEGEDKTNPNYIQYQWNAAGLTLENWQVAHFRILGDDKYGCYGTSVLEGCRRLWRQMTMLEDAVISYRLIRAPERRVFKIETGGIAPEDVEQYMEKVITSMKRHKVANSQNGQVDLRDNQMAVSEDFFLAYRNGQGTTIETLPGAQMLNDMDDIAYFRDKMLVACKIPPAYLATGDAGSDEKGNLAQKDVRFARTVQRLQKSFISELEKVAIIHLYTLGYKGADLLNFKLALNNPSKIAELQELEQWKAKFDIANSATEGYFSKRWLALNLFNISEDEFVRNQHELYHDAKVAASIEGLAAGAEGGEGGLGGSGGDLGGLGGDIGGGDDLGDMGSEEPTPEEAPKKEDDILLAKPEGEEPTGKRDDRWDEVAYVQYQDGSYETKGAKGKSYKPVTSDGRETAGRGKNYRASGGTHLAKNTTTNTLPGMKSFGKSVRGLTEQVDKTTYEQDKQFFESRNRVNELLKSLETKKNVKT